MSSARRALITSWLAREDTQLVLRELQTAADRYRKDYDDIRIVSNPSLVLQTHITIDVLENGIPKIIEGIMNAGNPPREQRWTFRSWFRRAILRESE